jgi:hypothetical protein
MPLSSAVARASERHRHQPCMHVCTDQCARARASGWPPARPNAERVCGGGVVGTRLSLNDRSADHRARKRRRRDSQTQRSLNLFDASGTTTLRPTATEFVCRPESSSPRAGAGPSTCARQSGLCRRRLAWPRPFVGRRCWETGARVTPTRRAPQEHCSPAPAPSWLAPAVAETTMAWAWRRAQQVVAHAFYQLREGQPIVARPSVAPSWPP